MNSLAAVAKEVNCLPIGKLDDQICGYLRLHVELLGKILNSQVAPDASMWVCVIGWMSLLVLKKSCMWTVLLVKNSAFQHAPSCLVKTCSSGDVHSPHLERTVTAFYRFYRLTNSSVYRGQNSKTLHRGERLWLSRLWARCNRHACVKQQVMCNYAPHAHT